ncbi:MAG: NAD-dependent epimerase/dehydratase family protein [Solirubrobacterales bacterium]
MKVIVTGASGNVGTSVLKALSSDPAVEQVVGLARRVPSVAVQKVTWSEADVTSTELTPLFAGADAVIHLAWAIQPSRDPEAMERVNVLGSERVFAAVAEAGVPALIYASSVGAYSEGPKDRRVDESWPTGGIQTSAYSRHKAAVESLLDRFEAEHPDLRVVRLRPGLIFKGEAASEIRRFFLGPLFPGALLRPRLIPVVPDVERLCFQAVHSDDAGEAYRLALTRPVSGPFNIAAEPVIGAAELAEVLGARPVKLGAGLLRGAAAVTWRAHLQPADPGWVDLALGAPLMSIDRARAELGFSPAKQSTAALVELLNGLRRGEGGATPPLRADAGGPFRARELASGIGSRNRV